MTDQADRERMRRHLLRGETTEGDALARDVRARALERGDLALASEAARRLGEFAWERLVTEEATRWIEEAFEFRGRIGHGWPETNYLASCLATLYWEMGRAAESRAMEERARQGLPETAPPEERLALSEILRSLASFESHRGRHQEARHLSARGLELLEAAPEADELEIASACVAHGSCLERVKDEATACREYERALEIRLERLGPDHVYTGFTYDHIAGRHFALGERERARELFVRGLGIIERALGPDHPTLSTPLVGLAAIAVVEEDVATALTYLERAVGIEERAHGPSDPRITVVLQTLALVHAVAHRPERAVEVWERIVRILAPVHETHLEPLSEAINNTFFNLAKLDRHEETLAFADPLLERWGRDPGVAPELLVMLMNGASQGHFRLGRPRHAEKLLRRAIGMAEKRFGSHALQLDPLLSNLAEILVATRRRREAEEIERRRRGIRSRSN